MLNKLILRSVSSQAILDSALQKGIKVKVISKYFDLIKLTHKSKSIFIQGTSFPVNSQPSCFIANNKFLTKKVLRQYNIPFPKSWLVRTIKEAQKLMLQKKFFPCVLKPAEGAHGNKVYANIESLEEFNKLLPLVFTKPGKDFVLIEKFIKGKDYRLLVVGDKVAASMERIPAHVIGDGKKNIRQLITKFNQSPLVGKKYEKPLCKIKLNGEVTRNLKKQHKKFTYIPKNNETIFLRQNANISTGGIGIDATDKISKRVKETAIKASKAIGMAISGVDIMFEEATKKAYVIELNDCPGIDIHHFPVSGKPRLVAKDIIEYILKTSFK